MKKILVYAGMLPCLVPYLCKFVSRYDLALDADHSLTKSQEAQFQEDFRESERSWEFKEMWEVLSHFTSVYLVF